MRNAFVQWIEDLAAYDSSVVLLSADIGNRMFDSFKQKFPKRFYNCGVAEANMISMAAGLASAGMKPVAYTIAPFLTTRCLEQIRIDICYHRQPVLLVGVGGGLSYSQLGPTHLAVDEISQLRSVPDLQIASAGDAHEVKALLELAYKSNKATYIRIGKKNEPIVHPQAPTMKWGKGIQLTEGKDICLLVSGGLLPIAKGVSDIINGLGISTSLWSMPFIKPLDTQWLNEELYRARLVVTIEENSRIGGLGSALCELRNDLAGNRPVAKILVAALPDDFIHHHGSIHHLRKQYQLDEHNLFSRVMIEYDKLRIRPDRRGLWKTGVKP